MIFGRLAPQSPLSLLPFAASLIFCLVSTVCSPPVPSYKQSRDMQRRWCRCRAGCVGSRGPCASGNAGERSHQGFPRAGRRRRGRGSGVSRADWRATTGDPTRRPKLGIALNTTILLYCYYLRIFIDRTSSHVASRIDGIVCRLPRSPLPSVRLSIYLSVCVDPHDPRTILVAPSRVLFFARSRDVGWCRGNAGERDRRWCNRGGAWWPRQFVCRRRRHRRQRRRKKETAKDDPEGKEKGCCGRLSFAASSAFPVARSGEFGDDISVFGRGVRGDVDAVGQGCCASGEGGGVEGEDKALRRAHA